MNLPYQFCNLDLVNQALTHPSATKLNKISEHNYERLEFFGDSILSMVIAELLYKHYSENTEGMLSIMHSNLVNSHSLAKVAHSIGLGNMLIMDEGEALSGGRENIKNLENAMEALIAAVYLDSDYHTVFHFIQNLWQPLFNNQNIMKKDKKSLLQEWAQLHNYNLPLYSIINKEGPSHAPLFTVSVKINGFEAISEGKSKKEAEQNAAAKLLQIIPTLNAAAHT